MALALALTTDDLGAVTLDITGAATAGTVMYQSNWAATVDGWAGGTTGAHSAPVVQIDTGATLLSGECYWSDQYIKRTVTGLTIGQSYRVTARISGAWDPQNAMLGVAGIGYGPATHVAQGTPKTINYDFVASAVSHDVRIRTYDKVDGANGELRIHSVKVTLIPAGLGPLQIQRTDTNGTEYVRLPGVTAPDSTGALTVVDYEAALTGIVTYVVRDGLGFTVSAWIPYGSGGAIPSGCIVAAGLSTIYQVDILEDYDETHTYQALTIDPKAIIGREDFTAPVTGDYGWSTRQGRLRFRLYAPGTGSQTMWAQAHELAAVYTAGRVVLFRQKEYPGMDLYHVAKAIRVVPADVLAHTTGLAQTWALEVDYVETGWPAGDLVGVDWTYADVATTYLAYWNLPDAFATYADLTNGV